MRLQHIQQHMLTDLRLLQAEAEQLHILYAQTFGIEYQSTAPPPLVMPEILMVRIYDSRFQFFGMSRISFRSLGQAIP